ncbi:MAG: hypothetical protein J6386_07575 [Candidatus Synoicihabitans palmerolidicus]|nr:hypothetical protein [Candidatus Synoicihabitans palmerolidicus]
MGHALPRHVLQGLRVGAGPDQPGLRTGTEATFYREHGKPQAPVWLLRPLHPSAKALLSVPDPALPGGLPGGTAPRAHRHPAAQQRPVALSVGGPVRRARSARQKHPL